MEIDNFEYQQICRHLEKLSGVFAKFWQIGRPIFDNSIETACVTFDRAGQYISFHFNPDYWEKLDTYNRAFIISHECLHIILKHGIRGKGKNRAISNITMDVVINEMLASKMGFDRGRIYNEEKLCWFDTVFNEKNGFEGDFLDKLNKKENFEYYYDLFKDKTKEELEKALKEGRVVLVDGHDGMEGDDFSDILDEVLNGVSNQELEEFKNKIEKNSKKELDNSEKAKNGQPGGKTAGSGSGSLIQTIAARKIIKKKKWETVIKKWVRKKMAEVEKEVYSFKKKDKRNEYLKSNLDDDFLLPVLLDQDEWERDKKKIDIIFIMDSSGSCASLASRFFYAAESVPSERFNVELACFDTQYYPLKKKDRTLRGFGGTNLNCVSDYIKANYYDKGKSPYLYVLSDGYSYGKMTIDEKYRKKWNFFLTKDGTRECIPNGCNIYELKDFE